MINPDRIVPVTKTDLLSLYSAILEIANVTVTKAEADDVEGNFTIATTGNKIASEPVKTLNFTAASGTVYFIPAYDYAGISVNGSAVTPTGEVNADGRTLYKAVLASGAVTITQVGV